MRIRDARDPFGWRDEGPSGASMLPSHGGSGPSGFVASSAIADGRCPICNKKMGMSAKMGSCIKLDGGGSWSAMRNRGRGGYRYGRTLRDGAAA